MKFKFLKSLFYFLCLALGVVTGIMALMLVERLTAKPAAIEAGVFDPYESVWKNPKNTAALSLNFSPYFSPGSSAESDSPLSEATLRAALDAVRPFADTIRTFTVSGEMAKLYAINRESYGMRVIAGAWIGASYTGEQVRAELAQLAELANNGLIDMAIVGSEGLLRGDYTEDDLIKWFNDLRGMLKKDVPVGTSDSAAALLGSGKVLAASDVLLFTYYPWFQNVPVDRATEDFKGMYARIRDAAGQDKQIICSESGWKFEGEGMGNIQPDPDDAARYLSEMYAFSREANLEIIFFEAFEEPWKGGDSGWGLLDTGLEPRPAVKGMLDWIATLR
ncbi:MAG: hypothetical protein LBR83_06535 [Clostridiales bacterium]|jgi:exo-beta-1,3-glucanase (GH17 family)|nr:hypothetical protein [Clostridiales bacterium]